jgi:hypothetical protein
MLYDAKRWDRPVRSRPTLLAGLVAWLEKQDATTEYDYTSPTSCLLARYMRSRGHWLIVCGPGSFISLYLGFIPVCRHIPRSIDDIAVRRPNTYGAALERARAAL